MHERIKPAPQQANLERQPSPNGNKAIIVLEQIIEEQEPTAEELFDGYDPDITGHMLKQAGSFDLLKASEELMLGRKIFSAQHALRRLKELVDESNKPIISKEQRSKIEETLAHKRNIEMLKALKNKKTSAKDTAQQNETAKNSAQESLRDDVDEENKSFYQDLENLRTFEDSGNKKMLEVLAWQMIDRQINLVNEGVKAYELFVEQNLRLVISMARRYQRRGLPLTDLIQEGNIGLMRATLRFDHREGFKFSTYATWWIRQAITRAIADKGTTIRIPVHTTEKINSMLLQKEKMEQAEGRLIEMDKFLERYEPNPDRRTHLFTAFQQKEIVSLDAPLSKEEGDVLTLKDFLTDQNQEEMVDIAYRELLKRKTGEILNVLSPRQRYVIIARYGLEDGKPKPHKVIGEELGVTRERVRQIESSALRTLRNPSSSSRLKRYWEKH